MIRFYKNEKYPLRIYIESDNKTLDELSRKIYDTFYCKDRNAIIPDEEDINTLIFLDDEEKPYIPSGLLYVIKNLADIIDDNVIMDHVEEYVERKKVECPADILEGRTLRDYQVNSVNAALTYKRGIIQAVTGSGKTSMILAVAMYLLRRTCQGNVIITVPTVNLLNQTYSDAKKVGFTDEEITLLGDGYELESNKRLLITTLASLYNKLCKYKVEDMVEYVKDTFVLMLDETHHSSAYTWSTVIDTIQAEYTLGFSAQPFYTDRENMIRDLMLRGLLGPVLSVVSFNTLTSAGYISKPYVISIRTSYPGNMFSVINWHVVNKNCLITNPNRNKTIIRISTSLIDINRRPLILVAQIKHGQYLSSEISKKNYTVAFVTGGQCVEIYRNGIVVDEYSDINRVKNEFTNGFIDAICGTQVFDEGVDLPALRSVVLAGGGKSRLKLIQRIGRGLRVTESDPYRATMIIDFQDRFNVVTRSQYNKRKILYTDNGFEIYEVEDVDSACNTIKFILMKRKKELGLDE